MAQASEVRAAASVRIKGELFKVTEADIHQGGGRMGALVHLKLLNLGTGAVSELRFNPKDEVEVLPVERTKMQYVYADGGNFVFMNPSTYDQVPIPGTVIGPAAKFLKENDVMEIEFYEGKPLSIHGESVVELAVTSTGAGVKGAPKQATLENGVELLVPDFIKEGDKVRVDVGTGKYLDRVREKDDAPKKEPSQKQPSPKKK